MNRIIIKNVTPLLILCTFSAMNVLAAPGYNNGANLPTTAAQTINAANRGVIANDGQDDAAALQSIIDGIDINNPPNNRIVIKLPVGEINLHDEVHLDRSGIIIEGAGSTPATGTSVVINSWSPYSVASDASPDFDKKYWPGFAAFRVETRLKHANEQNYEGSINYHWKHGIEFDQPAQIGDTVLYLERRAAQKFSVGGLIYVGAANDDAFLDLGQVPEEKRSNSHIRIGHMRTQIFKVVSTNETEDTVTLDKPLEFSIEKTNSTNYKSRVMPITAVQDVGFRNFHLTMENAGTDCASYNTGEYDSANNPNGVNHRYQNVCPKDAIHGLIFKWAYNGWAENVNLEMLGSHPIVTEFAKNMTFSNNKINGSWNKGAGGNGYFRGSKLYDSWIKGNDIKNVRHLTLQWSATGNLVENNDLNADFNLHGGWERNNIIRNNTIKVPFLHRSWTNGVPGTGTWQPIWYASGDHASKWAGPTGPHNVFLNNTLEKEQFEGAPMTRWGLFDEPNVEYIFNWDGTGFKHLNDNGVQVPTWTQDIAVAVHGQMPNSGVFLVDANDTEADTDNDGVLNSADLCPNTPNGVNVDADGCEIITDGDDDNDGVLNSTDLCPSTPNGVEVDANGCEIITDGDDDNDGVLNSTDLCPNTASDTTVDVNGCAVEIISGCDSTTDIAWGSRSEIVLTGNNSCIRFDRDLSGENTQFWDSNANDSCDFRGMITSVNGSGSKEVDGNYESSKAFTGTTLKLSPSNGCSFIKVRAY